MGEGDVKEGRKGNLSREGGGGQYVGVHGLKWEKEKSPLLSHLTLAEEIKAKAAGGRGVFISRMRNIF